MATFPLGLNTVWAIPRFPVTTDVMKLDVYPCGAFLRVS